MLYEIQFTTEKEKEEILNNNKDKYLLEFKYLVNGNFLIFSDVPTIEILQQEQGNKISILSEQNDQQEEIIASLTYELMMLQEPIALATLNNNHSPKFNLIKSWFNKGYWNEDMLLNAVEKHYITEEEMNEIIG